MRAEPPISREHEHEPGGRSSLLEQLLTTGQVAALLQMRASTVEDYARRGLLPSIKLGRHRRYLKTQLEQTLTAATEATPAHAHALTARTAPSRRYPR